MLASGVGRTSSCYFAKDQLVWDLSKVTDPDPELSTVLPSFHYRDAKYSIHIEEITGSAFSGRFEEM